jgi:hypothetical protein
MQTKEIRPDEDVYKMWSDWSPRSKKKAVKVNNLTSLVVIATSAVHFIGAMPV